MYNAKSTTYTYAFAAKGTEFGVPVVGTEDMVMSASAAGGGLLEPGGGSHVEVR